ncbi:24 kDa outer membrane protein [Fusobacterium sp. DD29]|uniref:MipA/OmpV family protein n=1 Tax=unclassified Fusobacterium TaxID=2648384 RepID=UPI001B8B8596|nr:MULTISPECIES: MipA/OmpV family protein [unclassified Fusobacterium]MBR8700980.1 24 kDa outer membrane protein [Fusobacterium sp. DD45]MBR8710832.1 24 kDa outer membrane protein [Fusobacterium sp. DD28]MBR8748487.1 24 kDa outer membrane protein [Fusobacterium sp. DD29]MBR8751307.1 24 kDa outer membrane protein [Fusobacterium sp. DD26]MBR8760754.1 24 kDa outer membrane protein [Fusobacterium sp. DD25]
MKKLSLLFGMLMLLPQLSLANDIGIGYGVTSPIYHSNKNNYVLPLVNFKYDDFFIKGDNAYGIELGYNLLERDNYVLSLYGVPFGGYNVKSKDMKSGYKSIDDRHTKVMGGVEFTYYPGFYDVVTSVSAEYGEKGGNFNLRVSKPYFITPNFTVIPTVTYTYYDSDFIDYYFGVEPHELNRQHIKETYDGKGAYRYGIGLLGNYKLTNSLSITGFTGVTKLSDEISDSPIADKDVIFMLGSGIIYTF